MTLLTNMAADCHIRTLIDLLGQAEEVWIFTAYLTKRGLNLLEHALCEAVNRGATIKMYCGLSQYVSQPLALKRARKILARESCEFRALAEDGPTYHPKLYCFFLPDSVELVVGSANLTRGGLGDGELCNREASVRLSVLRQDPLVAQIENFRSAVMQIRQGDLDLYEKRWNVVHQERRRAEERAKKRIDKLPQFFVDSQDLDNLISQFEADRKAHEDARKREEHLRKAKKIVNDLVDTPAISRQRFLQLYNRLVGEKGKAEDRLWHSNGLYRAKEKVADGHEQFMDLIRDLRENVTMSAQDLFGSARVRTNAVGGVGANVITELMNTLAPRRFAVLNQKSLDSMRHLRPYRDKTFFGTRNSNAFTAAHYGEFNAAAEELRDKYRLETMSQVDNFLIFVQRKKILADKQMLLSGSAPQSTAASA